MNQTETQVAFVEKKGKHWEVWCMDRERYYLWNRDYLSKLQHGFHVQLFYTEQDGFRSIKDVRLLTPVKPKFSEEDQRDLDLMCGKKEVS